MTSARERAGGLRARWFHFIIPPSVRDEFYRDIEAALIAAEEAGIERAAKVAEMRGWDTTARAIRALNTKEPRP